MSLNSVVKTIAYTGEGVSVTLVNGTTLEADYALVSFSLGVLQNEDVTWEPKLPAWKTEAIQSMSMVSGPGLLCYIPLLYSACRAHTRRSLCNSPKGSGSMARWDLSFAVKDHVAEGEHRLLSTPTAFAGGIPFGRVLITRTTSLDLV